MILRVMVVMICFILSGCSIQEQNELSFEVPRGYYAQLEIVYQGQQLTFGPFVGYYFKPVQAPDLTRLEFVCFNEQRFYTDELPVNARLYEGEAILTRLPDNHSLPEPTQRINPVFFEDAPPEWLDTRPAPQDEFVHFHSAYDVRSAVLVGYWLRHRPVQSFTYNMGGRLGVDSPLHHIAEVGQGQNFPHIVEFDYGPGKP